MRTIIGHSLLVEIGNHDPVPIPEIMTSITNRDIVKGHIPFAHLNLIRQTQGLHEAVAHHVSAANLQNLDPPALINHSCLSSSDKEIWDQAYNEEFDGLQKNPTWLTLTQAEFNNIKHKIN